MSNNSQKRQRHATPAAQAREQRTNGRVVLLDEVVLNQLNGHRRLANTTSTHNNLRRSSVMRGGACAQGHDVQQRTNLNSVISAFRSAKTKQRREADAAIAFLPPALANYLHLRCRTPLQRTSNDTASRHAYSGCKSSAGPLVAALGLTTAKLVGGNRLMRALVVATCRTRTVRRWSPHSERDGKPAVQAAWCSCGFSLLKMRRVLLAASRRCGRLSRGNGGWICRYGGATRT